MRLKTKFCVSLTLASSIFLAAFSFLVYEQARNSQFKNANQQLEAYVERTWFNLERRGLAALPSLAREGLYQKIWRDEQLIHDSFPQWALHEPDADEGIVKKMERNVNGKRFRLLAFFDLWPVLESLAALKRILWLGGLFAMGLFPALSYFLSGYLLRPFSRLSLTTSELNAQKLNFRFPAPPVKDEYGRLIQNFNQLLDRLEKSFSQTRNFATNASHELRTPLTVIRGEAELMLRRDRSAAEYRNALIRILSNAESLQKTIKQLLVLAHLQRMEHENSASVIALGGFISETIESLVRVHPDKNCVVQVDIDEGINYCGDREILSSIFGNLLENALKYSHGTVRVTADRGHDCIEMRIEDDGPGILDKNKNDAFKPFNNAGERQVSDGHGLGLSITKACVEAVRGTIELNNSNLGGLSVCVSLPV
jgi:signal transduction histidine kinase